MQAVRGMYLFGGGVIKNFACAVRYIGWLVLTALRGCPPPPLETLIMINQHVYNMRYFPRFKVEISYLFKILKINSFDSYFSVKWLGPRGHLNPLCYPVTDMN